MAKRSYAQLIGITVESKPNCYWLTAVTGAGNPYWLEASRLRIVPVSYLQALTDFPRNLRIFRHVREADTAPGRQVLVDSV